MQPRRLSALAIAREADASKGTAVAASSGHFINPSSGIFMPVAEVARLEGTTETIEAGFEHHVTKQWMELNFTAPVKLDWLGHFLTGILGTESGATVEGVTETTIIVSESGDMPAYTIFQLDPVQDDEATYGTVKKVELTCDAGGLLMADIEMIAQKREDASGDAVSYSTDHHLQGSHLTVKIAAATTNLSGSSAIKFHTMRLTIERDVSPIDSFGAAEPAEFTGGALRISGELTIAYEAETYRDYFLNGSGPAMSLFFQDTGTTIGTNNPGLDITLDKIAIVNHTRPDGIDEPDIETLTFEAMYDLDEGTPRMVSIVLTNEETTSAYSTP